MKLGLALRTMFRILGNKDIAQQIQTLLDEQKTEVKEPEEVLPVRSEALTMLSTLQREGRFIDFMMEPLDAYTDAQIGTAVRDVQRDCSSALKRMFNIAPLSNKQESATIEVPVGFDSAAYHLTGNITGEAPFQGKMQHHGWKATQCEMPEWTGKPTSILVVAPMEVEL